MKTCFRVSCVLSLGFLLLAGCGLRFFSRSGESMQQRRDWSTDRVLVRHVARPTLANLDFAAYSDNLMFLDTAAFETRRPPDIQGLEDLDFQGVLVQSSLSKSLPQILRQNAARMHWRPLRSFLLAWNFEKVQPLVAALDQIASAKWGHSEIHQPLQEPVEAWLTQTNEIWVKVEWKPWASFLEFLTDADADGRRELYGRVTPELLPEEAVAHIRARYLERVLSAEEIITWANELASFWYPTYNTDIEPPLPALRWPAPETEPEVVAGLAGRSVSGPALVIKGKPHGAPLYNVFVVNGLSGTEPADGSVKVRRRNNTDAGKNDIAVRIAAQRKRMEKEAAAHGGYKSWIESVKPVRTCLEQFAASEPMEILGLPGQDGFLFFRRSLDFLLGGDLQEQAAEKNPFPVITGFFDILRQRNIDFLFVPIPAKPSIYPEFACGETALPTNGLINPHMRRFMLQLLEAGVEVADLYSVFLEEKDRYCEGCDVLYQKQDTHWTGRGLSAAADALAARIREYNWYDALPKKEFARRDTSFRHAGDIVSRLREDLQGQYPPAALNATQILLPDGTPYRDSQESPILVLGDSFTGVFQRTYCGHAGVTAHLADRLGMPLHLIMSYGGGPTIITRLFRDGGKSLEGKVLVLWMMVERDLFDYWEDWPDIEALNKLTP